MRYLSAKHCVSKGWKKEDLDIPNDELMDHLDLLVDGKLKRAAVMLFIGSQGGSLQEAM